MMLTITLGDRHDLTWAQRVVTERHYLHQPVDPRARPMVYVLGMRYPGDADVHGRDRPAGAGVVG